jgi:hypothetical protein
MVKAFWYNFVRGQRQEEEKSKGLPSPVIEENEKVTKAQTALADATPVPMKPIAEQVFDTQPAAEDPSRSAYREKCKYWRRDAHALW